MKYKLKLAIFSFVFCLSANLALRASAESDYLIKFGMVEHNPYFYKENGSYVGYAVEDMRRICDIAGYDFESHAYPPLRLIKYLHTGEIDVAFLPVNLVGIDGLDRADTYISKIDFGFYHPKEIKMDFDNLNLNGKTLIVVKKYNYCGFLNLLKDRFPQMGIVEAIDVEATFKMLEYGRGDLLLGYKQIVDHMKIYTGDLVYSSQDQSDIVMVFSKKLSSSDSATLKEKLNHANAIVAAQANYAEELATN